MVAVPVQGATVELLGVLGRLMVRVHAGWGRILLAVSLHGGRCWLCEAQLGRRESRGRIGEEGSPGWTEECGEGLMQSLRFSTNLTQ